MMTEKMKSDLFEVVYAIERLHNVDYFWVPEKLSRIFLNYYFKITAEIYEPTCDSSIHVDFIDGVKPFEINSISGNTSLSEELTIAVINNSELIPFQEPGQDELKSLYKQFINENAEETNNSIKAIISKMSDNKRSDFLTMLRKEIEEERKKQFNADNSALELTPNYFYLLNEYIANQWCGGFFEDIVVREWEITYDQIRNRDDYYEKFCFSDIFFQLEEKAESIKLFINAHLEYENQIFSEKLFLLSPPWQNLINEKSRIFNNNIYSPIDKNDYIKNLNLSQSIQDNLGKIVQYVDALPLLEQKRATVDYIINNFREIGLEEYVNPMVALYSDLIGKFADLSKRTETGFYEVQKHLKKKYSIPSFIENISGSYRQRFEKIIKELNSLDIPAVCDNNNIYNDIFMSISTIAGELLSLKLDCDNTTITRIIHVIKSGECQVKLRKETVAKINKYSQKWSKLYNDLKHPYAESNACISYLKLIEFYQETNEVLGQLFEGENNQ